MLTTREKPRVIIQKNKSKHTDTARQQNKKEQVKKQGTMDLQNNQKTKCQQSLPINNYFKHKQIKFSNQKTQNAKQILKSKKQDPTICWLQKTHFSLKDTHRLKVKGWKEIFQANCNNNNKGRGSYIYIRQNRF